MSGTTFATMFLLGGAAWFALFMYLHVSAANKAKAALSWPVSNARIDAAGIKRSTSYNRGTRSTQYAPDLRYRFMANGQEWQGGKVRFGDGYSFSPRDAEETIARYPVGSTPPVRYNPANPAESVLELTPPKPTYMFASVLGLFFIGVSVWVFQKENRRHHSYSEAQPVSSRSVGAESAG